MDQKKAYQKLKARLGNRKWRLDHLYYIINKEGKKELLQLNIFQRTLLKKMWFLNIILKARQLGMSTFIVIYMLDACLFNSNKSAGIIDATLPDAKKKLKKCKFAYDNLPVILKNEIRLIKDNEQELTFSNGSTITADTTFRGDTLQYLHISEHAKICKRDPIKAQEIRTGALNAVAPGQIIFIESTAEDGEGDFYDLCEEAQRLKSAGTKLSKLDFKFFFFPWWENAKYRLEVPEDYVFNTESQKYFDKLKDLGIELEDTQKYFYVRKWVSQGSDIKKEYPSTPEEAFEATTEDKYYKELIIKARAENRICEFQIIKGIEVDTDWDLGRKDYTSIIFSQVVGKELRIVDFFEDSGEALPFYIEELRKKGYLYGKMWLPHDAKYDLLSSEKNAYQQMIDAFGKDHVEITPKLNIDTGINEVRKLLPDCWFKKSTTEKLIAHLEKYSKKWSEQTGTYVGPNHNEHSHAADCMRYLATRYKEVETKKEIKPVPFSYKPMGS